MHSLKILDVTLRDGGYVNDFRFGSAVLDSILSDLIASRVDAIELGFLRDCEYFEGRTWFNTVAESESLLNRQDLANHVNNFFLMIRPDWYDISKLEPCRGLVKNLRFAFHVRHFHLLKEQVKRAKDYGYNIYINPVNITSYSQPELQSLLEMISSLEPYGVAIVDTFGSLMMSDLRQISHSFDSILDPSISLCFHPHDNLLLSFALSQLFIDLFSSKRNIWIDSSLNGMGRAPGNLQTELILNFLNLTSESSYYMPPVFNGISTVIDNFKSPLSWGYHPLYAFSAFHKVHRSYPEFLLHSSNLDLETMQNIILTLKSSSEKDSFNKILVSKLVNQQSL